MGPSTPTERRPLAWRCRTCCLRRVPSVSASAMLPLSGLNPPPHPITVYASHPPSPTTTQHSLPGGALQPYRGRSFTDRTTSASPDAPVPKVRIHLPPAESRTNFRLSEGGDDPADADLLQRLDPQLRSSVSRPREFRDMEFHKVRHARRRLAGELELVLAHPVIAPLFVELGHHREVVDDMLRQARCPKLFAPLGSR